MTILTENDTSFIFSAQVRLLETERDIASDWAGKHIFDNPMYKWVIGHYVEADNANSNGQFWTLDDLRMKKPTIQHSPMNLAHQPTNIIGTYANSEIIYPASGTAKPFIETLGVFWKYYFPKLLPYVEEAHGEGSLFQSMECVADSVTCVGPDSCGESFPYKGPMHESYCEHIKERASFRQLNNPTFLAGALLFPPFPNPGWKNAAITDLANNVSDEKKDAMIRSIANDMPNSDPNEWERVMWQIIDETFKGPVV